MALRDIHDKELSEGDIISAVPATHMVDGIITKISPPMVQQTPQGQVAMQQVQAIVIYRFMVPAMGSAQLPITIADKAGSKIANDKLEHLKEMIAAIKPGADGGKVVLT
jgi:hypothetical protein